MNDRSVLKSNLMCVLFCVMSLMAGLAASPCVVVKKHVITDHFMDLDRVLLIYCVVIVTIILLVAVVAGFCWCYYRRDRFRRAYSVFRVDTPPQNEMPGVDAAIPPDQMSGTDTMHSCRTGEGSSAAMMSDRR